MLRIEAVKRRGIMVRRMLDPDPATTAAVARACHQAGLVALTCVTFGNVIRFLPPLVIGEDLLDEGLSLLEGAFAAV